MFLQNRLLVACRRALFAVLVGAALTFGPQAHADGKASATYLSEAFARTTAIAKAHEHLKYGFSEDIAILGGWVAAGASVNFDMPLKAGHDYLFPAAGDNDAQDVDLEILDGRGLVQAADRSIAPDAVVSFRPTVSGIYTLRLTLYRARQNLPCMCVATMLRKDGWTVPQRSLDEAVANLSRSIVDGDNVARQQGKGIDFHKAVNQWAVFGSVLEQGQSMSVGKLALGSGPRVFAAVADTWANDIDLFLLDDSGRTLKSDTRTNVDPAFFDVANGGFHELRVLNHRSQAGAVTLMAIFDIN